MRTLAATLEQLRAHLDAARLPARGLARALEVAQHLPARLSNCIYFEAWPRVDRDRLDVIVRLDPAGRDLLCDPDDEAFTRRLNAPGWRRVVDFARAWADPGGPLRELIAGAWLEFDLAPGPAAAPAAPRVFVDFERDALGRLSAVEMLDLVRRAVRPLRGAELDAAVLERLRVCIDHLPSGATLPYVGTFDPGEPRALRVCLRGLGRGLPAYLRAVGWPGDSHDLDARVMAPLAAARGDASAGASIAHVDLGATVGPRVGLEYTFARRPQLSGRLAEQALLEHLVARGWCDAETAEALARWPGQSAEIFPHEIWHSRVARRLNHVKLIYATGEPVHLKAYLCVYHELLADGTLVGGRPRQFGALPRRATVASTGDAAPTNGATAPSAASRAAAPAHLERPRPLRPLGTRFAVLWKSSGGTPMTMTVKEQQVLEAVLERSVVDYEFRQELLNNPRRAIQSALGISVPANFRVKFIEKDKNVDALVVLPNFQCKDGELSDDDLENVAGGGGGGEGDPDWGEVP